MSDVITIKPIKNGLQFHYEINTKVKKKDDKITCFIPSLDIYFSANDMDGVKIKSKALSRMYFDNYMVHSKNGLRKLIIELHKLGFSSKDNFAYLLHKYSKNEYIPSKFRSMDKELPEDFLGALDITHESKMEVAV